MNASRRYLITLMDMGCDDVLLGRIADIAEERDAPDLAHEARVRRWRNGWRPKGTYCRGRHNWCESDRAPAGYVWFHDGTWWTFPRRSAGRVERLFHLRSNPLDHEEVPVYEDPPPWQKRIARYREVEY